MSLGETLTLGTSSAALVFDTSIVRCDEPGAGAALPVRGVADVRRRSTSPSVLADYRRYFMPAPFYTLAARVMHYGRYGRGGEDSRLYPAVHRVSDARARLRRRTRSTPSECVADGVERLPGVRSADRQPHAGRQRRVPLSAAAAVRRLARHVWAGAGRSGALRRRRRRRGPQNDHARDLRRRRREASRASAWRSA